MKTDQIVLLAALGAAAFFLTRQAGAASTTARKNAAPLIWAQNPTAANKPTTATQNAGLLTAGLGLVTSLFGGGNSAYVSNYVPVTPDYGFSTDMLGTSSGQDLYAMNPPAAYYGLGLDTSAASVGSGWWN